MKTKKSSSEKIHPSTSDLIGRVQLLMVFFEMHSITSESKKESAALQFASDQTPEMLSDFMDKIGDSKPAQGIDHK